MAWFEHDGQQIHYEESGSGEPLLLMPGGMGSIEELAALRQALAREFRVIASDLPGSGKSQPQPRSYVPTYYHDDARIFLAMLDKLDAKPAHLSGFSDGGEYALVMAAMQPDAARSVVTWGSAGQVKVPPQMFDALANVVDNPMEPMKSFSDFLKKTYGEANARAMSTSFAAALQAINEAGGDISFSIANRIACPALLITGEHDFVAPPPLVQQLAGAIPHAEFVLAEGASHAVHDERGEWLIQTISGWLEKR